jgi:ribonuclease HI
MTIHLFINRYIADLGITNMEQIANKIKVPKTTRWIPPPAGLMKINVDAAISKNTNRASAAAIVRDGGDQFLGASALVVKGCVDPETMEAVACREGLALASDLMLQRFKLASDCESVVRSIRGEGRGPYGQIVKEIKDQASIFESCIIVHEGRSSNRDAHSLAKT